MNLGINDTFDNISFTESGKLVTNILQESPSKNEHTSNHDNATNCLKVSFDDSMFLSDSFSFSHASQLNSDTKENYQATTNLQPSLKKNTNNSQQTGLNIVANGLSQVVTSKVDQNSSNTLEKVKIITKNCVESPRTSELINKTSRICVTSKLTNNLTQALNETNSQIKIESPLEQQKFNFSQTESNKLSILGLPAEILQKYECRNVTRIFPWQLECLSCEGVLDNCRNLVYSAPTSAGKTLVAEILAVKTVLERNKKVIFILPFVSVVREKMFYFQDIFGSSGIRVEGFMGSYNPPGGFKNVSVAICTIEKANSLVNRLLEEGKLSEIGAVIVDELHLIGDPNRGYLLELLLTKLNYIKRKDADVQIQIVGMSATLPNLSLLGKWLNAALYVTTFRPIPLNEQCLVNGEIYDSKFTLTRKLEQIPELETDTDNILQLCLETLLDSCSVLVFCPTKNWCESLAVQIASAFFKIGTSGTKLGEKLRNHLPVEPIKECLEQLKRSPSGLDEILQKTVSFGVAFHHAGLTMDERDIIEGAFRTGGLRVLVATSTLSSGVNLPARRVIIRSPTFFGKPIEVLSYKQMVGRAGRMGKDTAGESILICQKKDLPVARDLISGKLEAITSCLEGSGRLKRAILEIIASGVASTPDEIEIFGKCTLLNHEGNTELCNPITDALDFLIKYQFVRLQIDQSANNDLPANRYVATPLAKACLNSSMPPEEGLTLFAELEKARQCFVLETELHLIYLVTPYSAQIATIDWMQFLEMWERLPASMKRVGELVGIKVSFIINCSRGKTPNNSSKLAVHGRFYTALALQDLVNEVPLNEVAQKYNCNRGNLQSLQQSAAAFAGRVTAFSRQLGWGSVELLIGQFQDRLQFGVSRELLDLMRLPILNGQRARVLFNAGVEGLVDLAGCNVLDLENILLKAKPFESKEREGESKHEAEKRNNMRTIFITGKRGLTELEAAEMMIADARRYLQYELGLTDAKWSQGASDTLKSSKLDESEVRDGSEQNGEDIHEKSSSNCSKSSISSPNLNISPKRDQDEFNLTSLHINGSSSSVKSSPEHLKDEITPNKSSDSLFNDSFTADMILLNEIEPKSKTSNTNPEVSVIPDNDSLLTKEFMDSFNESLNLNLTETSESPKKSDVKEENNQRKRSSKEIYSSASSSSSFASNCSMQSEDIFISPIPQKVRRSKYENKEEITPKLDEETRKTETKLEIINICNNPLLFETFLEELSQQSMISLSLGCENHEEEKQLIGIRKATKAKTRFAYKQIKVHGISVYWPETCDNSTTYYIELEKLITFEDSDALKKLELELMKKTLRIFNAKEQLKLLHFCLDWKMDTVGNLLKIEDPRIADWILDPESFERTFKNMVQMYLSKSEVFLTLAKEDSSQLPKIKACVESLLNWSLTECLLTRLKEDDSKFLQCFGLEMEIITILAKMEITGMPVNVKSLQSYSDSLKSHTQSLETEAYNIAGRRFSFTSSAAVKKVLNLRGREKNTKMSTNKAALVQYDHPLANIIIQWRKINATLTKMVYPLLRNIQDGRVRGTCITHNSTGRVSMHEPNLQNVPRDFAFLDPITQKCHNICIRGAFSVQDLQNDGALLVSADYCQLELRILAHLSKDTTLANIMRSDCDIFKAIAAKWMKIAESAVDDVLRQQTKQICYGIIYGIGNKSLAEQMNITEDEALEFCETFHQKYPGIRRFVKATIAKCEQDEFVETILGRRRYLPLINSSVQVEKSKAERQAVNTTIQGSAADIAKQAMILVDRKISQKFRNCRDGRNVPKLILQLHDELLYEVPAKYEEVFARLLKKCMQESVGLSVPLTVKVQSGKSWGSLTLRT